MCCKRSIIITVYQNGIVAIEKDAKDSDPDDQLNIDDNTAKEAYNDFENNPDTWSQGGTTAGGVSSSPYYPPSSIIGPNAGNGQQYIKEAEFCGSKFNGWL